MSQTLNVSLQTEQTNSKYTDLTIRAECKIYVVECPAFGCKHPAGRVDPNVGLIIQSPHGRKTHTLVYTFGMLRNIVALEGTNPIKKPCQ